MSIKTIRRMEHYAKKLEHDIKHGNVDWIRHWIAEIKNEIKVDYRLACEYKIKYILDLCGYIFNELEIIKAGEKKPSLDAVRNIVTKLESLVDQREVRDKLIKEVIHPFMKRHGYKKKARAFVRDNTRVNVYTFQTCDWYDVRIMFEVTNPDRKWHGKRPTNVEHEINQDTSYDSLKIDIEADMENLVKAIDSGKV
ncbi:hypothetical protein H6503_05620 [Candidatus Woesearchaeota archaeon]|nr:hypothetical protein [Candidatus Woesearchaeota archaeon]